MKTTIIVIVTFLLFGFVNTTSYAQNEKDTLKILFVGNSYTYFKNLPQVVSLISDSTKIKLVTKKSTKGGAKLREHWLGERGLKTKEIIKNGDFDIVVLQEFSMRTINAPDSTIKYSKLFCDYIKENKAKPYLYLTWAREKVPQYQNIINKVYLEISNKNEAVIVPVGKAWALAQNLRPDIALFNPDGSHPSELGTFLSACVFVATLSGEIPNELKALYNTTDKYGEKVELMRINNPLDVIFCKKIAEEIVLN